MNIININLLKNLTLFLASQMILSACQSYDSKDKRKNFIIIYTDDHRYDAICANGNTLIQTPAMDSLASFGANFSQAFVTFSLCTPSRAAMLTGRFNSVNGVTQLSNHYGRKKNIKYDRIEGAYLNENEKTIAQYLKAASYQTALIGKWHLEDSPTDCGFDYQHYFHGNGPYYGAEVIDNHGDKHIVNEYIESHISKAAVNYLINIRDKNKPFFLYYNTRVPHMAQPGFTWVVKDSILNRYKDVNFPMPGNFDDDLSTKPTYIKQIRNYKQALVYGYNDPDSIRNHMRLYYAAVEEVDKKISDLLKVIKQTGLEKNTYVILMGDNGWFLGEHKLTSKILPYEESIHVPLIISGPGISPKGLDQLVLNIDIVPTVLELADLPIPETVQGRSLAPLILNDDTAGWRQSILYEVPSRTLGGNYPLYAIRTNRYKYITTFSDEDCKELVFEELYDLSVDPIEMDNLIKREKNNPVYLQLKKDLAQLKAYYLSSN